MDKIDRSNRDWFQTLALTAARFDCIAATRDFLHLRLVDEENVGLTTGIEKCIVSGLIGVEKEFTRHTEELVRKPRQELIADCHPGLLAHLPCAPA